MVATTREAWLLDSSEQGRKGRGAKLTAMHIMLLSNLPVLLEKQLDLEARRFSAGSGESEIRVLKY